MSCRCCWQRLRGVLLACGGWAVPSHRGACVQGWPLQDMPSCCHRGCCSSGRLWCTRLPARALALRCTQYLSASSCQPAGCLLPGCSAAGSASEHAASALRQAAAVYAPARLVKVPDASNAQQGQCVTDSCCWRCQTASCLWFEHSCSCLPAQQDPTCGCVLPHTSLNWSLVLAGSEASTALRLEVRPESRPVRGEEALPMFHPGRPLGVPAVRMTTWVYDSE